MSWSFSINPVPKAEFDSAVDNAKPSGQSEATNDHADVQAAKTALKAFAKQINSPKVGGQAGGHVASTPQDNNGSLNANVYGRA